MKTKEELNTIKNEIKALNARLKELNSEELEQVTGGMSDIDDAILYGTVMGHIFNAYQAVQKTKNEKLLTMIPYFQAKCLNREYAEIVNRINELLPVGVFDSSDSDAYNSLKKAKEVIEKSGVLNS